MRRDTDPENMNIYRGNCTSNNTSNKNLELPTKNIIWGTTHLSSQLTTRTYVMSNIY